MKSEKLTVKNVIFFIIIVLVVIPQTRHQIQIGLHKAIALFSPSINTVEEVEQITSYNWQLKDLNGNTIDLNNSKSRVVLVNIWATWCPPCIAEMPSFQKLYNDYDGKIDFLFVSNEEQAIVKKFLDKKDYTFQSLTPISEAPETFNGNSIPRTFLIDRNGNIIIDKTGSANWNSDKVRSTINELIKL